MSEYRFEVSLCKSIKSNYHSPKGLRLKSQKFVKCVSRIIKGERKYTTSNKKQLIVKMTTSLSGKKLASYDSDMIRTETLHRLLLEYIWIFNCNTFILKYYPCFLVVKHLSKIEF